MYLYQHIYISYPGVEYPMNVMQQNDDSSCVEAKVRQTCR